MVKNSKARVSFIFTLIIIGINTYSQEYYFGLKSGLDFSTFKTTGYKFGLNDYNIMPGYHFELSGSFSITENLKIQIEPGYISKGGNLKGRFQSETHRYGLITVPVLIIKPVGKVCLEFGAEFAMKIYQNSVSYPIEYTKPFELSALTGISYNVNKNFNLGTRFGIGLTPTYDGPFYDYYNAHYWQDRDFKLYNRYFEFFTRFYFSKAKTDLNFRPHSHKLTFGIRTGYNISYLKGSRFYDISTRPRSGFHFNFINNYSLNKHFQIQIEPGFIETGERARMTISINEEYLTFKYGFFTIPFVFIIKPLNKLNLEIGTEFSHLIYNKIKRPDGSIAGNDWRESQGAPIEISGLAGLSYNITDNLCVVVRYGMGLTDIDYYYMRSFYDSKVYNRYFEFSIRTLFISIK